MAHKDLTKAVAYLRTSSRANVGEAKDSDKRQRAAIDAFAQAADYEIVDEFYDEAVSGPDPVTDRKGFAEMLERLMSNGARTIIVESPDRFARDLTLARDHLIDPFFDRPPADELMDKHVLLLADPEGAVGRLVLDGRVPPAVEVNHMRSRCQV